MLVTINFVEIMKYSDTEVIGNLSTFVLLLSLVVLLAGFVTVEWRYVHLERGQSFRRGFTVGKPQLRRRQDEVEAELKTWKG